MNVNSDFEPPQKTEVHDLETTICWIHDGIFWAKTKKNKEHRIEHAKEQIEILQLFTENNDVQKIPIICDVRNGTPLKKDVRDFYSSSQVAQNTKQFAFIVESSVSRVIANFFINKRKLPIPIKMFTDVKLALEWCEN
jgi:hypothetical protein